MDDEPIDPNEQEYKRNDYDDDDISIDASGSGMEDDADMSDAAIRTDTTNEDIVETNQLIQTVYTFNAQTKEVCPNNLTTTNVRKHTERSRKQRIPSVQQKRQNQQQAEERIKREQQAKDRRKKVAEMREEDPLEQKGKHRKQSEMGQSMKPRTKARTQKDTQEERNKINEELHYTTFNNKRNDICLSKFNPVSSNINEQTTQSRDEGVCIDTGLNQTQIVLHTDVTQINTELLSIQHRKSKQALEMATITEQYEAKIDILSRRIRTLEETLEGNGNPNEEHISRMKRITELELMVNDQNKEIELLTIRTKEKTNQNSHMERITAKNQEAMAEKEAEIDTLQATLRTVNSTLEQMRSDREREQKEKEDQNSHTEQITAKNQEAMTEKEAEIDALKETLRIAKLTLDKMRREYEWIQKEKEDIIEQHKENLNKNDVTHGDHALLESQIKDLQSTLSQCMANSQELHRSMESKNRELRFVSDGLQACTHDNNKLQTALNGKIAECERSTEIIRGMKQYIGTLESHDHSNDLSKKDDEIRELHETIADCELQRNEKDTRIEQLEKELQKNTATIRNHDQLKSEITDLNGRLTQCTIANERLQQSVENTTNKLLAATTEKQMTLKKHQDRVKDIKNDRKKIENESKELKKELALAQQSKAELMGQLERLQTDLEATHESYRGILTMGDATIEQLTKEVEKLQQNTATEEFEDENVHLRAKVKALQGELEIMKEKHHELVSDYEKRSKDCLDANSGLTERDDTIHDLQKEIESLTRDNSARQELVLRETENMAQKIKELDAVVHEKTAMTQEHKQQLIDKDALILNLKEQTTALEASVHEHAAQLQSCRLELQQCITETEKARTTAAEQQRMFNITTQKTLDQFKTERASWEDSHKAIHALKQQMRDMQLEHDNLLATVEDPKNGLRAEIENTRNRNKELDAMVKEQTGLVQTQQGQLNDKTTQIEQLLQNITDLKRMIYNHESHTQELKRRMAESEKTHTMTEQQRVIDTQTRQAHTRELTELHNQLQHTRQQLEAAMKNTKHMEEKIKQSEQHSNQMMRIGGHSHRDRPVTSHPKPPMCAKPELRAIDRMDLFSW